MTPQTTIVLFLCMIFLPSSDGARGQIRHGRQGCAWDGLIPKGGTGPIVRRFDQTVFVGDLLDRDPSALLPDNRVRQVPPVHRDEFLLAEVATAIQECHLLDAA